MDLEIQASVFSNFLILENNYLCGIKLNSMHEENKDKVNEPYTGYGQPATFEQVWKLFMETDKKFKETDKLLAEQSRETREQMKETDKLLTEKFQETDRKIDKLAKLYGGVSENSCDVAEEFFYRCLSAVQDFGRRRLQNRNSIFGIEYDQVGRLEKKTKKLQGEYDIVLYNGGTIIVIEVKYKLHPSDVGDFANRKLTNFRLLFPEYSNKKLIGGVAGLCVPNQSYEMAQSLGLLVLTQSGENISVMNPEGFLPRLF